MYNKKQDLWDKQNCIRISVKLNKNTDKEIIEKLSKHSNKQKYIKDLIKKSIE